MLARFAAETSSKRLAPLHPREHLPSRMSLDLLKISANGRARLCGAQANSYDGKRTLRRGNLLGAPKMQAHGFPDCVLSMRLTPAAGPWMAAGSGLPERSRDSRGSGRARGHCAGHAGGELQQK